MPALSWRRDGCSAHAWTHWPLQPCIFLKATRSIIILLRSSPVPIVPPLVTLHPLSELLCDVRTARNTPPLYCCGHCTITCMHNFRSFYMLTLTYSAWPVCWFRYASRPESIAAHMTPDPQSAGGPRIRGKYVCMYVCVYVNKGQHGQESCIGRVKHAGHTYINT